jgi:hypothetical protein
MQPSIAGEQALTVALILPVVGSKTASADLALARFATSNESVVLINHANLKRRHWEMQVAAAGQERQLDAHHRQSSQLHHAVAVHQHRRNAPSSRQPDQRTVFSQPLTNLRRQVIAGG